jgi:hypothetical protein
MIYNISIIISIVPTKESILSSAVEVYGSSLIVTLLYVPCLSVLANIFSSTVTTHFFISSKVAGFMSLNW